jgi:hypothetical protein
MIPVTCKVLEVLLQSSSLTGTIPCLHMCAYGALLHIIPAECTAGCAGSKVASKGECGSNNIAVGERDPSCTCPANVDDPGEQA